MSSDKSKNSKVEEPATAYKSIPKQKGIGPDFDFAKAFAEGLTIEEARKISKNKIREWWEK